MIAAYNDKKTKGYDMNSLELTGAITILANTIASKLTIDEMALAAGIFVQLGDTLATIAAAENLRGENTPCPCPCKDGNADTSP